MEECAIKVLKNEDLSRREPVFIAWAMSLFCKVLLLIRNPWERGSPLTESHQARPGES
jgi:hypothetical protein